ncbi:PREDICTED: flavin reductase (NADPH)-like [Wasmannia auropunctata]|uniref:flavin reductase (NADPH)-like n=1 Tax=Wasmannia auropunctata TaxID=64793 RepID=UPI0005F0B9E5|nr:PREDICTED: flavin reductase (NADPH)-like [Wasmannia auropunctata]
MSAVVKGIALTMISGLRILSAAITRIAHVMGIWHEMKKRIVIFGGTGDTGLCSLRTAVEKGLEVRAFVRDKAEIPEDLSNKVEAIVGDVTNAKEVADAIAGTDFVVVVRNTRTDVAPTNMLPQGMKNIVDAMKAHSVKLISVCIKAYLFYKCKIPRNQLQEINSDIDHLEMLEIIKSSGLKWVVIMPMHIADRPKSEYKIVFESGPVPSNYISKHDLGASLVECLEDPKYYEKVCTIGNVL